MQARQHDGWKVSRGARCGLITTASWDSPAQLDALRERLSAWPMPLRDTAVTYDDGVKATKDQEAKDVAAFLAWAAEPHQEERKQMGFSVIIYLLIFAGLLYASYKRIWRNVGH